MSYYRTRRKIGAPKHLRFEWVYFELPGSTTDAQEFAAREIWRVKNTRAVLVEPVRDCPCPSDATLAGRARGVNLWLSKRLAL